MPAPRLHLSGLPSLILLLTICLNPCRAQENHLCPPSSCGNIHNISFPLRLKGDPQNCGYPSYELACEDNVTVLYLYSGKCQVQAIDYSNHTLRVTDASLSKDDCSSLPLYSLTGANFSYGDPYNWHPDTLTATAKIMMFMKCENPVNSPLYVATAPCINSTYAYVMVGGKITDVADSCAVELMVMSSLSREDYQNTSFGDIHGELLYGFKLGWYTVSCEICRGQEYCYLDNGMRRPRRCSQPGIIERIKDWYIAWRWFVLMLIGAVIVSRNIFCNPFVMAFLIYTWRRRHLSMYDTVEEFLQSQGNLMPIRYSFSEIRKMTNGFKEKLGEGGYGSVYKGKLRSGQLAAVKLLGKSNANGQEFINEVGTIGRIHHVNVVRLIGFCAQGSKRALVYDFMPNGSVDKYISPRQGSILLGWDKLYEISLGVARGIDYLHKGCDMQILHFDIKPHNILLDDNFTPKVSDFGLAKLYPTDNNTITLTAARGTIGYIAPELFYKNIGGVSYKADVYSFGMLVMEMAGKRKNSNAAADHSSETYFPDWVYKQVAEGRAEIGEATEDDETIAKKMVTVALWCIQMKPSDRPPMHKVIEMLEGDLDRLELPPRPSLYPEEETPVKYNGSSYTSERWSSSMSYDFDDESASLINSQ